MGSEHVSKKGDFYLSDECWESVFQFPNNFENLSLVCKQFLSVTNRLRSSLTLRDLPFLRRLLHRFPNLTSLDLTQFHGDLDHLLTQLSLFPLKLTSLNLPYGQFAIPDKALQALNGNMKKTLTSLKCFNMPLLENTDLLRIFNCFSFLQELDLSLMTQTSLGCAVKYYPLALPNLRKINLSSNLLSFLFFDVILFNLCTNCEFLEEIAMKKLCFFSMYGVAYCVRRRPGLRCLSVRMYWSENLELEMPIFPTLAASLLSLKGLTYLDLSYSDFLDKLFFSLAEAEEGLPLRTLILKGCSGYTYNGIFSLLSKCPFLHHLDLQKAEFLNDQHVANLSLLLRDLISINVSFCKELTEVSLFELVKNCSLLSDVKMKETSIGKIGLENQNSSIDFVVSPNVKYLRLKGNASLRDETIQMFVTYFPNLELLDLSSCHGISDGIGEVLKRSNKIRHLNLSSSIKAKLLDMEFPVPKLEVLNLSQSATDDEVLYAISKSCTGLLQLDLENCNDVTVKGVSQVVEKCTKLREINLRGCQNVKGNFVSVKVLSRTTLRKIRGPPSFDTH